MNTTPNPLNALQTTILQAFLPTLTNIQAAFNDIELNPTQAEVATQFAVIQGQVVTLELTLPALVPALEGDAIAAGAQQASNGLGSIIAAINNQLINLNPPNDPKS
jgi:hypothetical protein